MCDMLINLDLNSWSNLSLHSFLCVTYSQLKLIYTSKADTESCRGEKTD